jgi:hypothetical protein
MKMRKLAVMAVGFMATLSMVGVVCAEQFRSPVEFYSDVNFDSSAVWKINGTKVTATAADLNAGLASSTASSVSNVNLKVFGSNITAVAGGTATLAGKVVLTPIANANVTNGQDVTLSGVVNYLTGTGSPNVNTNTITLALPTAAGQIAILYCGHASTNLIAIAGSGTFRGPAVELSAGQSAIIFAPTATNWAGIGQ